MTAIILFDEEEKLMADTKKQLRWYNVALIAFVAVWGLGNVVNNYAQQGLSVGTSWILIMIFYFVPYTLIVSAKP